MKNVMARQKLLNSVMGLATASLLVASPGVFAAGTGGDHASTGQGSSSSAQQQNTGTGLSDQGASMDSRDQHSAGTGTASQGSSMDERQQRSITGTQNAETSEQELSDTEGSSMAQESDQGLAGNTSSVGDAGQGQSLKDLSPENIEDKEIVNLNGEEIGNVQEVVTDADGSISGVVVSVGGVLEMGGTEVFANAEDIRVSEDQLVWQTTLDEDALSERGEYEAAGTTDN